jgi:hypothetical protein
MGGEANSKSSPLRKEVPKEETQVSSLKDSEAPRSAPPTNSQSPAQPPTLGESAKQFARGFAKGVGEESLQIYNDTKELPERLAKTGREVAEDIEAGRELRALAPLRAATHAGRNASRDDAKRIAQAVVDGAVEWYHKPAYEKGKDLGRATTSIAAEAAINVLTDGLGTLRKIEKAAEVADHFRDVEKGAEQAAHAAEHLRDVERGTGRLKDAMEVAPDTGPLWSATKSKSAAENAFGHWTKHRSEFPEFDNAKQYAEAAKSMAASPPADALVKKRGTDSLIYHPATNTFVVKGADGAPRTMFKPANGIDYWKKQ